MCGLWTRPRTDVDPPRVELPSPGASSRRSRAITCCKQKEAIADIRLRPLMGAAVWWVSLHTGLGVKSPAPVQSLTIRFVAGSWPRIICKYDVIHKPKVHNVSQRRRRRTGPRPQEVTCTKNKDQKFRRYACGQTDKHTNKQINIHSSQYFASPSGPQ